MRIISLAIFAVVWKKWWIISLLGVKLLIGYGVSNLILWIAHRQWRGLWSVLWRSGDWFYQMIGGN